MYDYIFCIIFVKPVRGTLIIVFFIYAVIFIVMSHFRNCIYRIYKNGVVHNKTAMCLICWIFVWNGRVQLKTISQNNLKMKTHSTDCWKMSTMWFSGRLKSRTIKSTKKYWFGPCKFVEGTKVSLLDIHKLGLNVE